MEEEKNSKAISDVQSPFLAVCQIETPIGTMVGASTIKGLALLEFGSLLQVSPQLDLLAEKIDCDWQLFENDVFIKLRQELQDYFKGDLKRFAVPLVPYGNAFSLMVWNVLQKIPYGKTWTYKYQAEFIGNPLAIRAIASANGRNPIAIIIPCHRVIGSNGSLTGYAGGIERKRWLLRLESENSPKSDGLLF